MTLPTCVIYNPAAGRGRAERLLAEFRSLAGDGVELRPTTHPGHGIGLAWGAAEDGFDRVVAAGGDGTVHEVANGILRANRPHVVLSVWPVGSANDLAHSLGMDAWWARRAERPPTETLDVDVGRVAAGGRETFFVGCLGVGFNGMVTVEARKTRWLKGLPLYAWAFLKAMVKHFDTPVMTVRFDGHEVTAPTLALSVLNAQREGNFPLRPAADLTDGLFDFMHATRLSRGHLLRFLPRMATGRLPERHPLLRLGRARRVEVRSAAELCAHGDGEFVCRPGEGVRELAVEVVPRRLRVEVFPPALYGRK